jgi:hypothetical protein
MDLKRDPQVGSGEPVRRHRRWPWVVLGVLLLLVIAVRLAADPLATRAARRTMAGLDDYQGTVAGVHVIFLPPGSVVHQLKLNQRGARAGQQPLLYVDEISSRVVGSRLLHGALELNQRMSGAKVTLATPLDRSHIDEAVTRAERLARRIPHLLRVLPSAKVDRMELVDGELLLIDSSQDEHPRLWIHDIAMTTTNMVTRAGLAGGAPMISEMRGRIQRSGSFTSRLSIPQPIRDVTFDMRAAMTGLALSDLHDFMASRTDLKADKGKMSSYMALAAKDGRLSGWMRPVMDNVEVASATPDFGDRVKAWLADKSVKLFSDEKQDGRERFAETIPIKGRIDPDRPVLASLTDIVRSTMSEAAARIAKKAVTGEGRAEDDRKEAHETADMAAKGRRTGARRR